MPGVCKPHVSIAVFLGLIFVRKWDFVWSIGVTTLVTALAWLIDYFLPVESFCKIVYMVPSSAENSDGGDAQKSESIVVDGCKLWEKQVLSASLDTFLEKEGMTQVACPVFAELQKEWILHAVPDNALPQSAPDLDEPPAVKKKRPNTVASALACKTLRGRAVIVPAHRDWRPTILGRIDMLTGMYKERKKVDELVKVVSRQSVIQIYKDMQAKSETMVAAVEEKVAEIHKNLTKRRSDAHAEEAEMSNAAADE